MGILIQDNSAVFTYYTRSVFDTDGLLGLWQFKGGSIVNVMTGKAAQKIGNPLVSGKVAVNNTSGLITDVSPTGARSFVFIGKLTGILGKNFVPVGEKDYSITSVGENVALILTGSILVGSVGPDLARIEAGDVTIDLTKNFLCVANFHSGGVSVYITDGITTNFAEKSGYTNLGSRPVRFGAFETSGSLVDFQGGGCELVMGAVYNRVLSEVDVTSIAKNYAPELGL